MAKYANYKANLKVLRRAPEQDLGNEFVLGGVIDKFAMQFELSWKLLRKTLGYEGVAEAATGSPRGVIKAAYAAYDFIDEELWLDMLDDRNAAEHIYDAELAQRLATRVIDTYLPAFEALLASIDALYDEPVREGF